MSHELTTSPTTARRLRVDLNAPEGDAGTGIGPTLPVLALAGLFILVGGGNLDLGPIEAQRGLAARSAFGPLGQGPAGWEPSLWPARVLATTLWAWGEGGATVASVRWPDAIAAVAMVLLLARRMGATLGTSAGLWTGLCLGGSLACIDRSAGTGTDWLVGLGVVGALDRILARRADLVAGLWAAFALLAGGWPPLTLIALTIVVLGRAGKTLSAGLLLPPLLAFGGWSAWAWSVAPARAWGAAVALPLTAGMSWSLALGVLAQGWPWAPFASLAARRAWRAGWPDAGRPLVLGWLQAAGVALLAGTFVPGLATPARMLALAGLAVVAAAGLDAAWSRGVARRPAIGLAMIVVLPWVVVTTGAGFYLASAVSYYRPLMVILIGASLVTGSVLLLAARRGATRGALGAVVAVAIALKLAHWGYYVPEWNYRFSQGPWGRAIGQWVPPSEPIFTLHPWPLDLLFATEHPVIELRDPRVLRFWTPDRPRFVLLQPSELEFWPETAPKLVQVRSFEDERGGTRILARTEEAGRVAVSASHAAPSRRSR